VNAWYMAHSTLIISTLVNVPLAISIQVVLRSGVFSFASIGFYGVGAYAAGLLAKHGFGLAEILPIVVIGSGLGGLLLYAVGIGRLRGLYMGMATFAFALILTVVESNATGLTGGANGLIGVPATLSLSEALGIAVFVVILISQLERRAFGRILVTMRVSEDVASTSGVNVAKYRRFVFWLSCALGAGSGALYVLSYGAFAPTVAGFGLMNAALTMAVLGGVGSWLGAVIGAVIVTWLPQLLTALGQYSNAIYGGLLVLVVMFAPQGIIGLIGPLFRRIADLRLRRAASAAGSADVIELRERGTDLPALRTEPRHEREALSAADADVVLQVENANVRFGGIRALSDVSLDLRSATVYGLIGPNGSGKTTLIGAVSRLQDLDSGTVCLHDWEFTHAPASETALRGISRTFQNIQLVPGLTVLQNVMVGGDLHWYGTQMGRSWLAPWWTRTKERELRSAAEAALEMLDLTKVSDRRPETLSYGTRRRVEIARAVVRQPEILLLDEPTAGMNRAEREEIGALLVRLRDQGLTIVLVEHDVEMVTRFCEYLYVLNFGRLIASGNPAECIRQTEVREAYFGRGHDDASERI
jgi:branched-chain amino acid transport system permease protein